MNKKYGLQMMLLVSFGSVLYASDFQQSTTPLNDTSILQPTNGQELIEKYKKIAAKNSKKGYGKSALYGAGEGAALGLIGATAVTSVNTLSGTETAPQQTTTPYNFGKQVAGPIVGVTLLGAAGGALKSLWDEAFKRNSTPKWIAQLELLNKDCISKETILYAGVPVDEVHSKEQKPFEKSPAPHSGLTGMTKRTGKAYLVSAQFDNIKDAHKDNHYELYLMPKDEYLVNLFIALNDFFQKPDYTNQIAFIGLRPTPGVTKSPFNSKNMPRIIIGFNSTIKNPDVIKGVIEELKKLKIEEKNQSDISINMQPRYSRKINNLMYVAYGSADYKDSAAGKKEYADKVQTWWQRWVSGPSDEAMAYKDTSVQLNLKIFSHK